MLRWKKERGFHRLLRVPEGADILGRLIQLLNRGALARQELQQPKEGHAVVAVGKGSMVVAAGTIHMAGYLFHRFLLFLGQLDEVRAGVSSAGGFCPMVQPPTEAKPLGSPFVAAIICPSVRMGLAFVRPSAQKKLSRK
jgi:hypothetical protein